jgi:enamine deaminase RidA (YjgF/YER057c/UK114 family)
MRQNVSSGAPWEAIVGYSRAVRVGQTVAVAGTVATGPEGSPVGESSYEQSRVIFRKIETALAQCGAALSDVVRTRAFVVGREHTEGFLKAHGEAFSGIRPAATLVLVSGLIEPGFFVEIEADAVVAPASGGGT